MTKLSVNINKIATLRNSRGGNMPDVVKTAIACENFGAQGITVHPRPDARHIRYDDVRELSKVVTTELNIEGYPSIDFVELVLEVKPTQVTLVPDPPEAITSSAGWDTKTHQAMLTEIIAVFRGAGIRTSIFLNPEPHLVEYAAMTGTDRIELYTEGYATEYASDKEAAIAQYIATAKEATKYGLGINAGHDLSLENLKYFGEQIDNLAEVSIGHALVCDALIYGMENTIHLYLKQLQNVK